MSAGGRLASVIRPKGTVRKEAVASANGRKKEGEGSGGKT
jgi:hypothetical protein